MAVVKFSKQTIEPNPLEVDYWVDITSDPYGSVWKYYNGIDWVSLNLNDGSDDGLSSFDYYTKEQVNSLLSGKADVDSVESKVDDAEFANVIQNIEFREIGDNQMEMVLLKYDNATVGVTIPMASETNPGMLSGESFRDFVKQSQLQSLYDELYQIMSDLSLAEKERNDSELLRKTNEDARISAETNRFNAENTRQSEEANRATSENNRVTAENNRNTAEQSREQAEGNRESTFNTLKGQMQTTIQEGQTAVAATEKATSDAQKVVDNYDAKVAEQDSKLSELGSFISENEKSIETLNSIINGSDICCINGELWSDNGEINIKTDEYGKYWHRSEIIPLDWFDNWYRIGLKLKSGNGTINLFYFDSGKNFIGKTKYFSASNIPAGSQYVAFHQYLNTSDGTLRQPVAFNFFGLSDVREKLRNVLFGSVTDDMSANNVVKELYLEGLDDSSNYGILSITKGSNSLFGKIYKIADNGYDNEGEVAEFYSKDMSQRIFEIQQKNESGINGYVVIDFDVMSDGSISYYAKINKNRTKSLEYNPTIKLHVKSQKLSSATLLLDKLVERDVSIDSGNLTVVSNRWTSVKYAVRGLTRVKVTGTWDNDKAAAIAYYTSDGTYIKDSSVAGVSTKIPTTIEADVPSDAEYAWSCSTNYIEPMIETVDIAVASKHISEKVMSNSTNIGKLWDNTVGSNIFPSSPCHYIHHLFIDKIYTNSNPTIPCQSLFDVYVAHALGFDSIEVNVTSTSDGRFVTGHKVDGKMQSLTDLNGVSVEVDVKNITFEELRTNYRYKSIFPQYRTPIASLEEFLIECKKFNLTPLVQCINQSVVELTEEIMGKRYIAYGNVREYTDVTINEYIGGTADDIINKCKSVGSPYMITINTTINNMSDDVIRELIKSVHANGCWIGWAASYHTHLQNERLKGLGLDYFSSGWDIPDFNECDEICATGNTIKGFSEFGKNDNGINLTDGQLLRVEKLQNSIISRGSLHINFKGSLKIYFGKIPTVTYTSDGTSELVITSIIENKAPNLYITAVGDVELYNVSYKVASVI